MNYTNGYIKIRLKRIRKSLIWFLSDDFYSVENNGLEENFCVS